jgi:predicted DNA-binding protein with PD1-like motif
MPGSVGEPAPEGHAVTFDLHRSDRTRHFLLRQSGGDVLPEALLDKLRDEGVTCGWLRASGVLADVEVRAYDARLRGLGPARVLAGPVQALVIEGAIGLADGVPGCSLRAVLVREGEGGLEVLAGELQSARAVALEGMVTAFDSLAVARAFDESAGVWLFARSVAPVLPVVGSGAAGAPGARGWSNAVQASEGTRMPQKPARQAVDLDSAVPEAGDVVEHFAFGLCDVAKSDGDRLHLRVVKDGRIKEIALEMLRVTPLDDAPPEPRALDSTEARTPRRFKLDRRM